MKNRFRKSKMMLMASLIAISPAVSLTALAQDGSTEGIGDIRVMEKALSDFSTSDNGDGTVTIVGYSGVETYLDIPSEIGGKTVTKIGTGAFKGLGITAMYIPSTIKEISEESFANNNLQLVRIPEHIEKIKDRAFINNKITSIIFSQGNIEIGYSSFENNLLTELYLPTSLVKVSDNAFANNSIKIATVFKNTIINKDKVFYNNPLSKYYSYEESEDPGRVYYPTDLDGEEGETRPPEITPPVTEPPVTEPPVTEPPVTKPEDGTQKPSEPQDSDILDLNLTSGELTLVKPTLNTSGFGNIKIGKTSVKSNLSFSSNLVISDARGTDEGWYLTVQATPFTEVPVVGGTPPTGGWHKLPKGSLTLLGINSITQLDDSGKTGNPNSTFIRKNSSVATLIDDGAVTLASAKKGEGAGIWSIEFPQNAMSLTVTPSTAKVDKVNYPNGPTPYQSTITWTVISGPGQ